MRRLGRLLAVILIVAVPQGALAFDACKGVDNPTQLKEVLGREAIAQSPVQYFDLARSIRLIVQDFGDISMPRIGEQQQIKFILLPPVFTKVACELVLATFLNLDGVQPDAIDQAARTTAKCLDGGGSQKACLVGFAADLDRRYTQAFNALSDKDRGVALQIFGSALHQIIMHEEAHHFLNHFERIDKQKLSRIDAEFEADLFAITNAVQAGEPESAMYYIFFPLSLIEHYTNKFTTEDYESANCRALNVENITGYLGIAPMMLFDAAFGGHALFRDNSPSTVRVDLGKQFAQASPDLKPGSCGHIAHVHLVDMRQELRQLYMRMEPDLDFLFAQQINLDAARASRLLRDLSEMSKRFRYMDGVAAKCIAFIIRAWEIKGRPITPLIDSVEQVPNTQAVTEHFLSEDFGRLLLEQGLAILQERIDMPPQDRLERSFFVLERAVNFNPALSEAWQNLALIAFKRADCVAASRFAERAVETFTDPEGLKAVEFFASTMKTFSHDPEKCRKEGAQYSLYGMKPG